MKCREAHELLGAYLDDEIAPSERALLEAHLEQCAPCRSEMAALAQSDERLGQFLKRQAAAVAPSPQVWKRLRARIGREARLPLGRLFRRLAGRVSRWSEKRPFWARRSATVLATLVFTALLLVLLSYPEVRTMLSRAARGLLAPYWQTAQNGPPSTVEPGTEEPVWVKVNQTVKQYSDFAQGDVAVELRAVEFYPEKTVVHWAMTNTGRQLVRFPMDSSNILVQDNAKNQYPVDHELSVPQVLVADPGQQAEGTCTIPRQINAEATTLLISTLVEPFASSPWSIAIPRQTPGITPTPLEAYPQPERTPYPSPLP